MKLINQQELFTKNEHIIDNNLTGSFIQESLSSALISTLSRQYSGDNYNNDNDNVNIVVRDEGFERVSSTMIKKSMNFIVKLINNTFLSLPIIDCFDAYGLKKASSLNDDNDDNELLSSKRLTYKACRVNWLETRIINNSNDFLTRNKIENLELQINYNNFEDDNNIESFEKSSKLTNLLNDYYPSITTELIVNKFVDSTSEIKDDLRFIEKQKNSTTSSLFHSTTLNDSHVNIFNDSSSSYVMKLSYLSISSLLSICGILMNLFIILIIIFNARQKRKHSNSYSARSSGNSGQNNSLILQLTITGLVLTAYVLIENSHSNSIIIEDHINCNSEAFWLGKTNYNNNNNSYIYENDNRIKFQDDQYRESLCRFFSTLSFLLPPTPFNADLNNRKVLCHQSMKFNSSEKGVKQNKNKSYENAENFMLLLELIESIPPERSDYMENSKSDNNKKNFSDDLSKKIVNSFYLIKGAVGNCFDQQEQAKGEFNLMKEEDYLKFKSNYKLNENESETSRTKERRSEKLRITKSKENNVDFNNINLNEKIFDFPEVGKQKEKNIVPDSLDDSKAEVDDYDDDKNNNYDNVEKEEEELPHKQSNIVKLLKVISESNFTNLLINVIASVHIWTVASLAYDRYYAIANPLQYLRSYHTTKRRTFFIITWTLSLILGLLIPLTFSIIIGLQDDYDRTSSLLLNDKLSFKLHESNNNPLGEHKQKVTFYLQFNEDKNAISNDADRKKCPLTFVTSKSNDLLILMSKQEARFDLDFYKNQINSLENHDYDYDDDDDDNKSMRNNFIINVAKSLLQLYMNKQADRVHNNDNDNDDADDRNSILFDFILNESESNKKLSRKSYLAYFLLVFSLLFFVIIILIPLSIITICNICIYKIVKVHRRRLSINSSSNCTSQTANNNNQQAGYTNSNYYYPHYYQQQQQQQQQHLLSSNNNNNQQQGCDSSRLFLSRRHSAGYCDYKSETGSLASLLFSKLIKGSLKNLHQNNNYYLGGGEQQQFNDIYQRTSPPTMGRCANFEQQQQQATNDNNYNNNIKYDIEANQSQNQAQAQNIIVNRSKRLIARQDSYQKIMAYLQQQQQQQNTDLQNQPSNQAQQERSLRQQQTTPNHQTIVNFSNRTTERPSTAVVVDQNSTSSNQSICNKSPRISTKRKVSDHSIIFSGFVKRKNSNSSTLVNEQDVASNFLTDLDTTTTTTATNGTYPDNNSALKYNSGSIMNQLKMAGLSFAGIPLRDNRNSKLISKSTSCSLGNLQHVFNNNNNNQTGSVINYSSCADVIESSPPSRCSLDGFDYHFSPKRSYVCLNTKLANKQQHQQQTRCSTKFFKMDTDNSQNGSVLNFNQISNSSDNNNSLINNYNNHHHNNHHHHHNHHYKSPFTIGTKSAAFNVVIWLIITMLILTLPQYLVVTIKQIIQLTSTNNLRKESHYSLFNNDNNNINNNNKIKNNVNETLLNFMKMFNLTRTSESYKVDNKTISQVKNYDKSFEENSSEDSSVWFSCLCRILFLCIIPLNGWLYGIRSRSLKTTIGMVLKRYISKRQASIEICQRQRSLISMKSRESSIINFQQQQHQQQQHSAHNNNAYLSSNIDNNCSKTNQTLFSAGRQASLTEISLPLINSKLKHLIERPTTVDRCSSCGTNYSSQASIQHSSDNNLSHVGSGHFNRKDNTCAGSGQRTKLVDIRRATSKRNSIDCSNYYKNKNKTDESFCVEDDVQNNNDYEAIPDDCYKKINQEKIRTRFVKKNSLDASSTLSISSSSVSKSPLSSSLSSSSVLTNIHSPSLCSTNKSVSLDHADSKICKQKQSTNIIVNPLEDFNMDGNEKQTNGNNNKTIKKEIIIANNKMVDANKRRYSTESTACILANINIEPICEEETPMNSGNIPEVFVTDNNNNNSQQQETIIKFNNLTKEMSLIVDNKRVSQDGKKVLKNDYKKCSKNKLRKSLSEFKFYVTSVDGTQEGEEEEGEETIRNKREEQQERLIEKKLISTGTSMNEDDKNFLSSEGTKINSNVDGKDESVALYTTEQEVQSYGDVMRKSKQSTSMLDSLFNLFKSNSIAKILFTNSTTNTSGQSKSGQYKESQSNVVRDTYEHDVEGEQEDGGEGEEVESHCFNHLRIPLKGNVTCKPSNLECDISGRQNKTNYKTATRINDRVEFIKRKVKNYSALVDNNRRLRNSRKKVKNIINNVDKSESFTDNNNFVVINSNQNHHQQHHRNRNRNHRNHHNHHHQQQHHKNNNYHHHKPNVGSTNNGDKNNLIGHLNNKKDFCNDNNNLQQDQTQATYLKPPNFLKLIFDSNDHVVEHPFGITSALSPIKECSSNHSYASSLSSLNNQTCNNSTKNIDQTLNLNVVEIRQEEGKNH